MEYLVGWPRIEIGGKTVDYYQLKLSGARPERKEGPPGDRIYAFLETTAYLLFPPVWPFVFRSNETQVNFKALPGNAAQPTGQFLLD